MSDGEKPEPKVIEVREERIHKGQIIVRIATYDDGSEKAKIVGEAPTQDDFPPVKREPRKGWWQDG